MTGRFEGKVALVTGGASGIGRATALAMAREGAKVIIADRNGPGGEETVEMIASTGGEGRAITTDVTCSAEVDALMFRVVATYGRLDCAINNAGIGGGGGSWEEGAEDVWDRVLAINLKGVWLCMQAELRQMAKQGDGSIVNSASIYGLVGSPRNAAYIASKHGVVGLTKSAALAYARAGIRVNTVCPAYIHTPMTTPAFALNPGRLAAEIARHPFGRLGTAEEVAEAIMWLCSEAASYITGHALAVDGGFLVQ